MQGSSLGHQPNGKWEFDAAVSGCFSDMLMRSIPYYPLMRAAIFGVGKSFAQAGTSILDLGCSNGDSLQEFVSIEGCSFVGVDVSGPMIEEARRRFANSPRVQIFECDLRTGFPNGINSVILSILTLQFTPIEYRQQIARRAFKSLVPGGAFILVEKILGATAELDDLFVERYLKYKASNGYSQDEIDRKRLSLEGVLVPVTARWNEELLQGAGFRQIDCFWRWMNFAGWVAVKE